MLSAREAGRMQFPSLPMPIVLVPSKKLAEQLPQARPIEIWQIRGETMPSRYSRSLSGASLFTVMSAGSLVGIPALAQQQETSHELEEIIVTATKRRQSLIDVPVAVSALQGETISEAGVRDIKEMEILAPALVVNSSLGPTQTVFTIRGIGTQGINTGLEQSVGVFVDGVYRGRAGAATTDFIDLSRVEVLRGPQGTLFGRNTSAGVISVSTVEPGDQASANADVSVGDYGYRQLRGVVSGPLSTGVLAASLAVTRQVRDGFLEDVRTGEEFDDRDRTTVRGQLLWTPSDGVRIRTIADYTETDEKCCIAVPIFYGPTAAAISALGGTVFPGKPGQVDGFTGSFPDAFTGKVAVTDAARQPTDSSYTDSGVSTELTWEFGDATLTAIGAYRYFDTDPVQDSDFSPLALFSTANGQEIDEYTFEVRLASSGRQTVDWTVGLFYFDQEIQADQYIDYGADLRRFFDATLPRVANPFAPGTTTPILGLLERVTGRPAGTFAQPGRAVTDTYDYSSASYAAYGQATWNVTDQLSVTGGLRYSYEKKDADYDILSADPLSQIPLTGPLASFAPLRPLQQFPQANPFTGTYDDGNVTGTLSVAYRFSDSASVYARYATGYKSGGLNLSRTAPQTTPGNPVVNPDRVKFDAETVESYELGTKLRLFGRRVMINSDVFYQTLDNFQNNIFTGTGFTIVADGTVEGYGWETDVSVAATDYLTIDGGLVVQDIHFDEYRNAPPTSAQQAAGRTTQDLSGRPVPRTSDVTATLAATLKVPVTSTWGAMVRVDARYRSDYYTNSTLEEVSKQDDYVTLNLSVGVGSPDGAWAVEFWARNLTDTEIYNQTLALPFQTGTFGAFIEPPRTVGLTLRARF